VFKKFGEKRGKAYVMLNINVESNFGKQFISEIQFPTHNGVILKYSNTPFLLQDSGRCLGLEQQ